MKQKQKQSKSIAKKKDNQSRGAVRLYVKITTVSFINAVSMHSMLCRLLVNSNVFTAYAFLSLS